MSAADISRSELAQDERPPFIFEYHGACEKPFVLPLRRELLFKAARLYDVYGKLPEGAVPYRDPNDYVDAPNGKIFKVPEVRQWASVRCGKCEKCAYRRYMRYATAAKGWYRTTRLTMFVSFTFGNSWFSRRWKTRHENIQETAFNALAGLPGFDPSDHTLEQSFAETPLVYDANDADHFSAVRQFLVDERQRFMKRLRHSLERRAVFSGVKLVAHVELMELGDLRGRPHLHGCFNFDYEGEDTFEIDGVHPDLYLHLREEMKRQWHDDGEGVGFLDAKRVNSEEGGNASAAYVFKYLLKLIRTNDASKRIAAETRIATSLAYIGQGRKRYDATLDAGDEPAGEESGLEGGADATLDHSLATGGVHVNDSDVPFAVQVLARKVAQAREEWNLGELWPGTNEGLTLPETEWRWLPPHESDFMGWLQETFSRFEPPARHFGEGLILPGDPDAEGEEGKQAAVGVPSSPISSPSVSGEVLRRPITERAMEARGLTPDTVIQRNGTFGVHPDEILRRRARNGFTEDGTAYDLETGEIIDEA